MKFLVEVPDGEVLSAYPDHQVEEAITEIREVIDSECSFTVGVRVTVVPELLAVAELHKSLRSGDVAKFGRLTGAVPEWTAPPVAHNCCDHRAAMAGTGDPCPDCGVNPVCINCFTDHLPESCPNGGAA